MTDKLAGQSVLLAVFSYWELGAGDRALLWRPASATCWVLGAALKSGWAVWVLRGMSGRASR